MVSRLRRTDELKGSHVAGPHDVVDLVVAFIEHTGAVEPPHDVHAPVEPRQPHVPAHGQRHRAPGALNLVGQLDARGGRADHEHSALRRAGPACGIRPRVTEVVPAGSRPARAGSSGRLYGPLASTTLRHVHSPLVVLTT